MLRKKRNWKKTCKMYVHSVMPVKNTKTNSKY